jgi:folate-binding protein YgfZ
MSSLAEGGYVNFSARAKFRITGEDRLRFVNGQVTNDVRKATSGHAIQACVLNAKGKIDAHVFISAEPEALVVDTDTELRETLPPRLDRYIIADDVQVEDISDSFALFHVLGSNAPNVPKVDRSIEATRFGSAGWDLWVQAAQAAGVRQQLSIQLPIIKDERAEQLRVELGLPRWTHELTNEIIPQEANLESSCIDFEKGCYIGQEIISRIKMSGQTNKRLCGIIGRGDAPLATGMKLVTASQEGREIGWITSAIFSECFGRHLALAFVKRGLNMPGAQLDALAAENPITSAVVRVEVVPLPFALSH